MLDLECDRAPAADRRGAVAGAGHGTFPEDRLELGLRGRARS